MKADDKVFPVSSKQDGQSKAMGLPGPTPTYGLTARDYIAIKSPLTFTETSGMIMLSDTYAQRMATSGAKITNKEIASYMAAFNYWYADAMIEESNK